MKIFYLFNLLFFVSSLSVSQNSAVYWYAFDMGLGSSTSEYSRVTSVIGQSFTGSSFQSNIRIESGFLSDTLLGRTIVSVSDKEQLPSYFYLGQNYPNPFNPRTTIVYTIPIKTQVILKIFDIVGREVCTLVNEEQSAGEYNIQFQTDNLASGVYFYRIQARDFSQSKKLILLR